MAQTTKEILAVQLRTELKPQLHVAAAGEARGPSAVEVRYGQDYDATKFESVPVAKPHDLSSDLVLAEPVTFDDGVERFRCSLDRR